LNPGFLAIDKPCGPSSFALVKSVRRQLGGVKTGHAGTLDPAASGLLVLALGSATRLLPFMPLEPKTYLFSMQLGTQTDSLDAEGSVVKSGGPIPEQAAIEAVLPSFTGTISQVPPDFSAVKIQGVRAYVLARRGQRLDLAARKVRIGTLRLVAYDRSAGRAELEVSCSGGTYVRSLARDIAAALGTCAYAPAVRRISAGVFSVECALAFDKIAQAASAVIPVWDSVQGQPRALVGREWLARLREGRPITCNTVEGADGAEKDQTVFAFDDSRNLVAVLKRKEGKTFQPVKVFV
jgi:tRNA pseudouridine55 synthase